VTSIVMVSLSLSLLLAVSSTANAAELKVFCTHALTPALEKLGPGFETATGNKLVVIDSTSGAAVKRIQSGEVADVALLTGAAIRNLAKQGKLDSASVIDIGSTGIAVGVRAGAPKPDISSVAAFKQTLLSVKSLAYSDPADGAASGIHINKVLERLGLADQLRPKITLVGGGGAVGPLAASGAVEMVVQMESELRASPGVTVVGPLPAELQDLTLFSAAVFVGSKNIAGANSLIQMLKSPKSAPLLEATGMQLPK